MRSKRSPKALARSSALAAFGLTTCFAADAALAEIASKADKSDRAVIVSSLKWQPNTATDSDWISFRSGTPNVPRDATLAVTADHRGSNALNDAFDLFAKSDSSPNTKSFQLRTASLDPNAVWVPGGERTATDATAAAPARAPLSPETPTPAPNQIPLVPRLGFAIPVPRPKPPVPKVVLASLTPASGSLPDVETHQRSLEIAPVLGEPKRIPFGATAYLDIFRREAANHKIPLWLALGVAWVESKFDPKLGGTHDVVGMMQVMPSTAREMGYRGTKNGLRDAETNIIWGMKELAKDYELAKGDICMTIAKYKGGFRTNHINKGAWNYCTQVKRVTGMTEVAERYNNHPPLETTAATQQ